MAIELDAVEQRVLGSLLEKERTVPDTYPLTAKALRSACNQTSGRDPVLSLAEAEVVAAAERLKAQGLARVVHAGSGARATRYRQVADERLTLDDAERAVVTVLLLRGPQTPGELRGRSDRLHAFASLEEVDETLARLRDRSEPLVVELEREPGQKERRWAHLLGAPAAGPGRAVALPPPPPGADPLRDGARGRDARVVAAYDTVASTYADRFLDELDGKPFDRWLLERLAGDAGRGPVADVGCGPGHIAAFVATAADGPVTAFDLSEAMVAEARRRFPDLDVRVADLRQLPAPDGGDGGWALITAWYALVHFVGAELPEVADALAGRLRPGGRLALAVHVGGQVRHVTDWSGHRVDLDLVLHDAGEVLAAVEGAGLEDIEWYRRSPNPGEETERLYVVARRP